MEISSRINGVVGSLENHQPPEPSPPKMIFDATELRDQLISEMEAVVYQVNLVVDPELSQKPIGPEKQREFTDLLYGKIYNQLINQGYEPING